LKPIKIKKPAWCKVKPRDDFDTWWITMQVDIQNKPERFPKDERTIDWIDSLMDQYAAALLIPQIEEIIPGVHLDSLTNYSNALRLHFEYKEARDEAYVSLGKVKYVGCIRDMFTQSQMHNDKAMVSRAASKRLILEKLPNNMLEYMHTINLTG
jgi:hypothetical protein